MFSKAVLCRIVLFPCGVDRQIVQHWRLATSQLVRNVGCKKHLAVKLNSTGLPMSLVLFMADSPITFPLNSVLNWDKGLQEK